MPGHPLMIAIGTCRNSRRLVEGGGSGRGAPHEQDFGDGVVSLGRLDAVPRRRWRRERGVSRAERRPREGVGSTRKLGVAE